MPQSSNRDSQSNPLDKLTHDISGPLTSILLNCEMLLDEDCSTEARRRAQTILAEAMKINSLLREARLEKPAA
jgi:K+-sensing histidine kinase KdpD